MTADVPTILATSAGFRGGEHGPLSMRPGRIHYFAAELAGAGPQPRICLLHQATGDQETRIGAGYAAFAGIAGDPLHLSEAIDIAADLVLETADACAVMRRDYAE